MERLFPHLKQLRREGREIVLWATGTSPHREIDLKNWRGNRARTRGFLPEERAWLSRVFDELGWVDVFRCIDCRPEQYTWGQIAARRGEERRWRIDYQLATRRLAASARRCLL